MLEQYRLSIPHPSAGVPSIVRRCSASSWSRSQAAFILPLVAVVHPVVKAVAANRVLDQSLKWSSSRSFLSALGGTTGTRPFLPLPQSALQRTLASAETGSDGELLSNAALCAGKVGFGSRAEELKVSTTSPLY